MSRAGPANAITWKNLSPVSRDPGTAMPGSRLTGLRFLARFSCNRGVDFCCTNVPRSRQTDTSPAHVRNRAPRMNASLAQSRGIPVHFRTKTYRSLMLGYQKGKMAERLSLRGSEQKVINISILKYLMP